MVDVQKLEKYIQKMPIIPDVATKVIGIAESGKNISFKELEDIIKIDPGLTAKILKVANSALYARQQEISTLQMAITLLGFKNIKSLVILTSASAMFVKAKSGEFYRVFWRHSVMTAFIAKEIIVRSFSKLSGDEGFLAGLLHDIGQVAIYYVDQEQFQAILDERNSTGIGTKLLEEEHFGITHKDLGARALTKWNFPQIYIDVAKEHGSLNITSEHRELIVVISIADILADRLAFGDIPESKKELLDKFTNIVNLSEKDLEYYTSDYVQKIAADPLFVECQNLFHFTYTAA